MTSILALAVVGSWTYAGFLAEPTPAPPPPPASAPTRPAAPAIDPEPEDLPEPEPEPTVPPAKPEVPSASIPPAAPMYRLADAWGQAWDHADPNYLRSFVEARNRSLATRNYTTASPYRASRCFNGRCR